jgi:hypothetical protein
MVSGVENAKALPQAVGSSTMSEVATISSLENLASAAIRTRDAVLRELGDDEHGVDSSPLPQN